MEGPSLTLRYATAADSAALLALGSDPQVTRFFSWGPYTSVDQPERYIAGLEGERQRGERLDLLIVDRGEGQPIGVTGLTEFSQRDRRAVVGTWLGRARWGTGANRESKALIAHLAFAVLRLERLGAYADLDNPRSQTALERIGFAREGVLRNWHRHGERVHDVVVYSWLLEEWRRSPLAAVDVVVRGDPPPAFGPAPALNASAPPLLPAEAAHRERDPEDRPRRDHAERGDVRAEMRVPLTIAAESPSIRCLSGSAGAMPLRNPGRVGCVVEHAGDEDHGQEHGVDVGRRRVEVRDRVRERDAERGEADHAGGRRTRSARTSPSGQPVPKNTRPATVMIAICTAVFVTALPAIPAR